MSAALFTAAQIATALQITKRAAWKRLKQVRSAGAHTVRGQRVSVWSLALLPEAMRAEIIATASRGGFRDACAFLSSPRELWQPPAPLAECAPESIEKARKLSTALAGSLQRLNDTAIADTDSPA